MWRSRHRLMAGGVLSWVAQGPPRESHLWDWCQETLCQNIVWIYRTESCHNCQITSSIPCRDGDHCIQTNPGLTDLQIQFCNCNTAMIWINSSRTYFNAGESESDCQNCGSALVDSGQCWECVTMSRVKCLSSQLCPGRVRAQNPDRPHWVMSSLWLLLLERHSTSVNTSAMQQPRSGCVLFVSEEPRYSGICHDARGINL